MAYSKICVYCHVVTLEGYNAEAKKILRARYYTTSHSGKMC